MSRLHIGRVVAIAGLLGLASCASVAGPPQSSANLVYGSAYVFRGVPQVDAGVFQPDFSTGIAFDDGSSASLAFWGNMDLESDNGDAVFGGGNSGSFTEIDVVPEYAWTMGDIAGAVGLVNYSFPNSTGASTTEAYASIGGSMMGLDAGLTAYYDIEEVEGLYVSGSLAKSFEVGENLGLDVGAALGYVDDDQGAAYFGAAESGLADLMLSASLGYAVDEHMSLSLGVHASSIISSDLEEAVDMAGIETDNVWFTFGVGWSY